jgi:chromosomal replication initiation ATPase DnaA
MYLVKRCCDRTLPEMAEYFGTKSYATVSWNCRVVESKMTKEMKFKDRIEKVVVLVNSRPLSDP